MDNHFEGKILIFTAPSGAGKTTLVRYLLNELPELAFSVSATTRSPRDYEVNGVHYYFLSNEEFLKKIKEGQFIEYEEVYDGILYGTLKSELTRLWKKKKHVVFDIDVKGAQSIKKIYGDRALVIFVRPPSIEELERRLTSRGTDTTESIKKRVAKFEEELQQHKLFDTTIINDNLELACSEAKEKVLKFLQTT